METIENIDKIHEDFIVKIGKSNKDFNQKLYEYILENLDKTLKDKTVLFITHRIFSVMNFDKIIVLDDGKIAELGNHATLIEKKGIYFDLYQLQQASELHEV